MSGTDANPQTVASTGFRGLPGWLRIGIIAAGTVVVLLVAAVIVRIILQAPNVPLGLTSVSDLQPGSCLLESGSAGDQFTVVPCSTAHQQQVIASVDLAFPGVDYTADESLAIFASETCKRLLEYRLYLPNDLPKTEYETTAIAPPTLAQYEAGDTETLCAVLDNHDIPEKNGQSIDLTSDLYRPLPQ